MSFTGVTSRQSDHIRSMANAKEISRDQFQAHGLDNGVISTALDAIKLGRKIRIVREIEPPQGGRIYTVRDRVVLDREWQEAVNAAGPDTPANYNVRKVGDLYLPTGTGVVESEMTLVNFGPQGGSYNRALEWARQYDLKRTDPRRVFAIAEHKQQFHRELGMNLMWVAATDECTFGGSARLCYAWWYVSRRVADLSWTGYFDGPSGWFAFSSD